MTPEQLVALIGAITALVVAVGTVAVQLRGVKQELNGRMSDLLAQNAQASRRLGELEGRDFMRRLLTPPAEGEPPHAERRAEPPTS